MVDSNSRSSRNGLTVPYFWDNEKRRELVALYLDGMDVEMLAAHLELRELEVLKELVSLLLGVKRLEVDPSVPRFRMKWESLEDIELFRLYRRGLPVDQIAERLGRDGPGVAIRLINSGLVVCPSRLAEELGLNDVEEEERD